MPIPYRWHRIKVKRDSFTNTVFICWASTQFRAARWRTSISWIYKFFSIDSALFKKKEMFPLKHNLYSAIWRGHRWPSGGHRWPRGGHRWPLTKKYIPTTSISISSTSISIYLSIYIYRYLSIKYIYWQLVVTDYDSGRLTNVYVDQWNMLHQMCGRSQVIHNIIPIKSYILRVKQVIGLPGLLNLFITVDAICNKKSSCLCLNCALSHAV